MSCPTLTERKREKVARMEATRTALVQLRPAFEAFIGQIDPD